MHTGAQNVGYCVNVPCEIKAFVVTEHGDFYDLEIDGVRRWVRVPAHEVEQMQGIPHAD